MWVEMPGAGRSFDAIAFNYAGADPGVAKDLGPDGTRQPVLPTGSARLVYRLDINEYQGERRLQLLVDHVLPEH
jgi:hypothetical protein